MRKGIVGAPRQLRRSFGMAVVVVGTALAGLAGLSGQFGASAHDGFGTSPTGIVGQDEYVNPSGGNDDPSNGYRVFLSSPRHADSGSRGECMNPGRQENVNGRLWNWYAGNGNWIINTSNPSSRIRNLHARGYTVRVTKNSKDNGYIDNKIASQNWGSDLHIVTHTNANSLCPDSADYLLTMWANDADAHDDYDLAQALRQTLTGSIPGPSYTRQDSWAELSTQAPQGDAYVELQFHSNQSRQTWLYNNSPNYAYLYGLAVDQYLNYP